MSFVGATSSKTDNKATEGPLIIADGAERYGLIHTDSRNQKRTIKNSGLWFGRVAATNRLDW